MSTTPTIPAGTQTFKSTTGEVTFPTPAQGQAQWTKLLTQIPQQAGLK